jgi:recombinational DNA repair ATPase RecF
MLKSVTLRNFKSYREAKLYLAATTFLIGPNASGKSNALEAIRLLSWLAKGQATVVKFLPKLTQSSSKALFYSFYEQFCPGSSEPTPQPPSQEGGKGGGFPSVLQ